MLAGLFFGSRLLIAIGLGLAYLANTSRLETGFDDIFCNWDCDWYLGIAEHGYQSLGEAGASGAANWAFFPLLPIAMWAISHVSGMPAVYCGLLIAQVGSALTLYFVFLAARDRSGTGFARHMMIVAGLWPFAIHAAMPMTEAVFLPLSAGLFLFARRGNWLAAALFGALASATRTVGVMFVLPMLILAVTEFGVLRLMFLRPGTERAVVALMACGLGLGLYMIYLHGLTGDALAFSHNQIAWGRRFELPWMTVLDELNPAFISPNWLIANALDVVTGGVAIALTVFLWRQGFVAEAIFAGVTLLIAFDTGNASSLPRYAGGLYPMIVAVAVLTDTPLRRVPGYAALGAGLITLAIGWGLEQFYVM